jgi:Ser/Thr protein kinase RdoA (MazF antagonist)
MNLLNRNPDWHGLKNGKMPLFPEHLVRDVLKRFGVDEPQDIVPWPMGPFDILAMFEFQNHKYLLKGRPVEQRGIEALFGTQRIQMQLFTRGFPVPELLAGPSGEMLVQGVGWKDNEDIYYEVQTFLPGVAFEANHHTAGLAGKLLAQLHTDGEAIQVDIISKFDGIDMFVQLLPNKLKKYLENAHLSAQEQQELDRVLSRLSDSSCRTNLTRRLTHGDFTANNILISDKPILVDLDELGYGIAVLDLAWGLYYVARLDVALGKGFYHAYRENGPDLHKDDIVRLKDYLVALSIEHLKFSELQERMKCILS